jgi:hypothetical protein
MNQIDLRSLGRRSISCADVCGNPPSNQNWQAEPKQGWDADKRGEFKKPVFFKKTGFWFIPSVI